MADAGDGVGAGPARVLGRSDSQRDGHTGRRCREVQGVGARAPSNRVVPQPRGETVITLVALQRGGESQRRTRALATGRRYDVFAVGAAGCVVLHPRSGDIRVIVTIEIDPGRAQHQPIRRARAVDGHAIARPKLQRSDDLNLGNTRPLAAGTRSERAIREIHHRRLVARVAVDRDRVRVGHGGPTRARNVVKRQCSSAGRDSRRLVHNAKETVIVPPPDAQVAALPPPEASDKPPKPHPEARSAATRKRAGMSRGRKDSTRCGKTRKLSLRLRGRPQHRQFLARLESGIVATPRRPLGGHAVWERVAVPRPT